jgi:asparagine synthase (glutamine-hydrolysing)
VNGQPVDRGVIAAMGWALRHRGPDDAGTYIDGSVGLAHRRLSVIDPSPAGRQPMANKAGTLWVVFNGEIYNFQKLRAELATRYAFRSGTDTEVILALYEAYGLECVSRLRGMFAFAIWDAPRRRLVLARDRLGEKPLFYRVDPSGLSFASELKALLVEDVPALDPVAIHHYLTFQYVPAPRTVFAGIRKLPPGHFLVYEKGSFSERRYWSLSYDQKRTGLNEREAQAELRRLLEEAVRLQMVSDVPHGALLSGGLDSSSVVACMSRLAGRPVKTFSVGFKEPSFNELPYARQVADQFGTEHHECLVEPSAVELLPALVRAYDEPFADASAIPTYCVARFSRQSVTVLLTGDGGDELLAGYPRYRITNLDRMIALLGSDETRERLRKLVERLPTSLPGCSQIRTRLLEVLAPFSHRYLARICYFSPSDKDALYSDGFRETVRGHDSLALLIDWFEQAAASELLDRLLAVDTGTYLPDDLLVKVDRASMAHAVETRAPFLDHHLVEFAASLPVTYKVRRGETKYLLKQAMRSLLPDPVLARGKMGFGVPLDQWFRGELSRFVRDVLLSGRCLERGYFRPQGVRTLIEHHQAGLCAAGSRLYALVMLELWHREYVDQRPSWAMATDARERVQGCRAR